MNLPLPEWVGTWFAVFPTVETLAAQALAAATVLGSYFYVRYVRLWRLRRQGPDATPPAEVAPAGPLG